MKKQTTILKVRKGITTANHTSSALKGGTTMSLIETILYRAMSDIEFADMLFAQPDQALADYCLTAAEIAQLKSMSRVDFELLAARHQDQRKGLHRVI